MRKIGKLFSLLLTFSLLTGLLSFSVGAATGAKKIYTYEKDTGGFTLLSFGEELISGTDYAYKDGVLSIKSSKPVTIRNKNVSSATTDSIFVDEFAGEAHITLSGVNIDASKKGRAALGIKEQCENTVHITLAAETSNILIGGAGHAGLEKSGYCRTFFVPGDDLDIFENEMQIAAPLMIDGKGSLTAKGGRGGAGIGGYEKPAGEPHQGVEFVTIFEGNITAIGGEGAAGIGGGKGGFCRTFTMVNGTVTAIGGTGAAGIGSGADANLVDDPFFKGISGDFSIRGGTLAATGGKGGAGIGSGVNGAVNGSVDLAGGTVTLVGGGGAPAIGGPVESHVSVIMSAGASVKATPGSGCRSAVIGDTEYYQLRIDDPEGKPVILDGKELTVTHHLEEKAIYTLLPEGSHVLQIGDAVQELVYDEAAQSFVAYTTGDFKVTGNVSYGDVSYEDGVLTVKTEKPITIANRDPAVPTEDRISVSGGVKADITLAGVNIKSEKAAFSAAENKAPVSLHLAAGTKNTFHAGLGYQALASNGAMVTVDGEGALTAIGGLYGAKDFDERLVPFCAAIDGGKSEPHLTINGGTITALGGPAKDGSGYITVNGGSLKMPNSDAVVTNSEGVRLYPLTVENPKGERVLLNGESYAPRNHALLDDTDLYLWLPAAAEGESCSVIVGQTPVSYAFDAAAESWKATETVLEEDSFAACISPTGAAENYPGGVLMNGKLYYLTVEGALSEARGGSFSADDVIELSAETTKLKSVVADRLTLLQDVPGALTVAKNLILDVNGKTVGDLRLQADTVIVQDSSSAGKIEEVTVLSGAGILDGVNCTGRLFTLGHTLHLLSGSYDLTKTQNWGRIYVYGGSLSFAEPVSKIYDGTTASDAVVTWNGKALAGTVKYDSADALAATKVSFTTKESVFPAAVTMLHGARITPVQVPAPTVSISGKYKYTGSPITPSYSITMAEGYENVPYRVSITDNVRPGAGKLTVQPDSSGNYAFDTVTASFTINKVLIEPTVTVLGSYTYTGAPIIPDFTVEDDYEDVTESDYTFSVSDNINVGMATLTVSPAPDGNYRFSPVTVTFAIERAALEEDVFEIEVPGETQEGPLGTSPEEHNVMTGSTFSEHGSWLILGGGALVALVAAWVLMKRKKIEK